MCEMIKALFGITKVNHTHGRIPNEWSDSVIIKLFNGKGDALEREGNYRGLNLLEHAMKILERVIESMIRECVEIDAMQCGFMCGTSDAIFIFRQLQEKHLAKSKDVYFCICLFGESLRPCSSRSVMVGDENFRN